MQLEKATSRSNEAALAGWISSNDATLFTTVLVLAIAMFLFSQLNKGAREKSQISEEKQALAERLQSTASDLEASNTSLDRTREALQRTHEERNDFQQQLLSKLDEVARLNAKLDVIVKEKGELESQRRSLLDAKDSLTEETIMLTEQRASLTKDRDSLRTVNASLSERLETITNQLAEKITAFEQLEEQRDLLKQQADDLGSTVADLKQRQEALATNLAQTQDRAAADLKASKTEITELRTQLVDSDKKAEDYRVKLEDAAAFSEGLQAENEQLQVALSEAEQQRQTELLAEARQNRELVGLKGPLERVAILIDVSGSMRQPGSGGSDRWAEAQEIAASWLRYLNVSQCVLIVFSADVRTFPDDGTLADLRGEAGNANRELLLQHLKSMSPGGWTNTHDALRKAYEYDIDSILLFSDGAPTNATSGQFDVSKARQIYDLCHEHRDIPIHTIGLGNYFDQNASTFLRTVAKATGGTFRGR